MAKKYIISAENAEEIKEYRKGVTDKYFDRRLYAVQLLGEGMKVREIAEKLDVDRRQISMWAAKYCKGEGIKGLIAYLMKRQLINRLSLISLRKPGNIVVLASNTKATSHNYCGSIARSEAWGMIYSS